MTRGLISGLAALALWTGAGDGVPAGKGAGVADFKLSIALFGAGKDLFGTAELVVRGGVGFQFVAEDRDEVQILDPARSRVTLLNFRRKVQTEFAWNQLDASLEKLRRSIASAAERREASDRRADRLAAATTRDLIDPKFESQFDPKANRLRLANATVEVEADGEPDPDPNRLALVGTLLTATAKLAALRGPEGIPPFTRIEALERLARGHKLRPTAVSMLFRLNGPPKRLRWTFRLVPELTDREREAIARVERLRSECRFLPFLRYEEAAGRQGP